MARLERGVALWAGALCLGLAAWLCWDVNSMAISYKWHFWLVDQKTGEKIKPNELLQLGMVLNKTQDYIDSTNAIERLYDLEKNLNIENPFPRDEVYSSREQLEQSAWPVANRSLCASQLDWILEKLAANKDYALLKGQLGYELTQLMDSFGRPDAGSLTGSPLWMGSYDQCMRSSLNGSAIEMRYCWARLRLKWWPHEEQVYPSTRIKVGICIPETCETSSYDHQRVRLESLTKHELPEFFQRNLIFDSLFCLPDERSPIRRLPADSLVFLLLCGAWLALVIIASAIYSIEKSRRLRAVQEFDLAQLKSPQSAQNNVDCPCKSKLSQAVGMLAVQSQLKDFMVNRARRVNNQVVERKVELGPIDFAKLLMAILVIFAHSFYLISAYARSRSKRIDLVMSDGALLTMSLGRCNDAFFLLFGVLSAYMLLRRYSDAQLASPSTWILNNWHKLIRVGPLFMLVFWYTKLISVYTGQGPWWDYGVFTGSTRGFCLEEPWWKSIPYLGLVGVPPISPCTFPGWFVVVYVKLSLLMPLLTYIIYKLPNHTTRQLLVAYALLAASLQSIVKMDKQISFKTEAFTQYGAFLIDLIEKFESTGGMSTLGKLGPVTLGCYVGYLLRMYDIGDIKRWPRWCTSRLTLASTLIAQTLILWMPVLGRMLAQPSGHVASLTEFLTGFTVSTCLWSLVLAVQIICITTVYSKTAPVRFIGHHFWHVFNKLGFAIYLIHWEVLWYYMMSYEQGPSHGHLGDIFKLWATGVFYTIPIAFLVHILFEMPATRVLHFLTLQLTSQAKRTDT